MKKTNLARTLACLLATTILSASGADWVSLFDGKTLNGWKASEKPGSFRVEQGMIAVEGPRSHLFFTGTEQVKADFKNFELECEILTKPGANSGVYFHTEYQENGFPQKGFEAQVSNTHIGEENYRELKKTGSLYGIRNVYKQLIKDEEWFKMHISVRGKRIQILLNDTLVVDYVEPSNPVFNPKQPGRRLSRGTFALQGHDPKSRTFFKNIRVQPLPDDLPDTDPVITFDAYEQRIVALAKDNFPVINFHTHLKGGLTVDEVRAESRKTGIFNGIAVNCGLNFAVTNDTGIEAYLKSMEGQPVFIGMQAEGREWVNLFSPAARAKFDYVFTDAMTVVDDSGKRMRLWIKEEVGEIPDAEAFMKMLVSRTVTILSTEPIDIYVNPTYLPAQLAPQYDQLWTPERMQRVVDAAAKRGIAIEINSRSKLPSAAFLKLAKQAGVKFTFGTNNTDKNIGRLDYCFQMVDELNLKWQDMWMPKPGTR
ncbi:MAG: family 16 glycoside hydrolase [Verrucomicrobiota bacterium]